MIDYGINGYPVKAIAESGKGVALEQQLKLRGLKFEQLQWYDDYSIGLMLTADQALHLAEYIRTNGFTKQEA